MSTGSSQPLAIKPSITSVVEARDSGERAPSRWICFNELNSFVRFLRKCTHSRSLSACLPRVPPSLRICYLAPFCCDIVKEYRPNERPQCGRSWTNQMKCIAAAPPPLILHVPCRMSGSAASRMPWLTTFSRSSVEVQTYIPNACYLHVRQTFFSANARAKETFNRSCLFPNKRAMGG